MGMDKKINAMYKFFKIIYVRYNNLYWLVWSIA